MHPRSWTQPLGCTLMKKTGRKNHRYSAKFKICAILDMRKNHLCYEETVRKYWPNLTRLEAHNHVKTLQRWERIYLEEGEKGLMEERRGRARGGKKGRPPKLAKSVEEDLIAENQRLRMEIAYIKKLSALVLANEQAKRNKRRSSQN